MAQPAPPSDDLPRALPRRASAARRDPRPRFQPLDVVWIILLVGLSAGAAAWAQGVNALQAAGTWLAAGTVAAVYLLGWRTRDRAAGLTAALLLATSLPFFSEAANDWRGALLALLTTSALFAFVAGWTLPALLLAGGAALARPDGLLLGLLLLGLAFAQRRPRAWPGALLLLLIAGGGWAALILMAHQPFPTLVFAPRAELLRALAAPSVVFVCWFLLPLAGEAGDAARWARWLPILGWAFLLLLAESLFRFGPDAAALLPFRPVLFVLSAGGLSRLLPTLAGDIPRPLARYALATLAVLSLAAIHVWLGRF
ncbi:MAG: hypothetical protein ACR2GG_03180 [Gemmatimonadaceae bacterium]